MTHKGKHFDKEMPFWCSPTHSFITMRFCVDGRHPIPCSHAPSLIKVCLINSRQCPSVILVDYFGLAGTFLTSRATVHFNLSTNFTFNRLAVKSLSRSVFRFIPHLMSFICLVGLSPQALLFFLRDKDKIFTQKKFIGLKQLFHNCSKIEMRIIARGCDHAPTFQQLMVVG